MLKLGAKGGRCGAPYLSSHSGLATLAFNGAQSLCHKVLRLIKL